MPEMAQRRNTDAVVFGALLRSGDPMLVKDAIDRLAPMLAEHGGNLFQMAQATGIAHRTLCRWQADSREFARAIDLARRAAAK
jgi:hypothetical protein